jgi:hypothetical protein
MQTLRDGLRPLYTMTRRRAQSEDDLRATSHLGAVLPGARREGTLSGGRSEKTEEASHTQGEANLKTTHELVLR